MKGKALQCSYRPRLARRALEQCNVHRKRQACLAIPAARGHGRAHAQGVIQIGRMNLRAFVRRASIQATQCVFGTGPCSHKRAVAGAVLQADGVEAIV